MAKPNSYVIVDEAENHLNVAIINNLWNVLEEKRSDCQFVYLTHDPHFALSRVNANVLWSKKYSHPNEWEIEPLPKNRDIPEELLIELLGSRNKIVFCEGKKSSLDYKLYSVLFPKITFVPVGGHINVISYTGAYNRDKKIFGKLVAGLIDGDYHSVEEK